MKKRTRLLLFFVATVSFLCFLFVDAQDLPSTNVVDRFPYKINFTPAELKLLNSLDEATLTKLILVAQNLLNKNAQAKSNQTTTAQQPTQTANPYLPTTTAQPLQSSTPSAQTPYYNPATGQYQNTPASISPTSSMNPYVNSLSQYAAQPAGQYSAPFQGNVSASDFANTFPDPGKGTACEGYGVTNAMGGQSFGGAAALSSKLKKDLAYLCLLTGKKLVVTSGRRGQLHESAACGNQSQHNCGHAIDTSLNPYTDDEKTVVTLYFMAHGYGGIGSYGSGPMHFDHRTNSMRWGPPGPPFKLSNCQSGAYYTSVQKAFALVGYPPCSLPNINDISQKAIQVLKQMGKEKFAIGGMLDSQPDVGTETE